MLKRSAMCSSLYQRLNSFSLSAGTSHHTMRSPAPFLFAISASCRFRRLGKRTTRRGIRFERAPEPELLADLAHRGQHFFAHQADARARVLRADEAVARPESDDRRPRLLEQAAQLREDGLWRARDDLLVPDLVFERGPTRVRAAAHRVLHEGLAHRRREVAGRARPHRMREA